MQSLTIFDHDARCDEAMPPGTHALVMADMSAARPGKATRLEHGVSLCAPDDRCENVDGASIYYREEGEGALWVGEITVIVRGRATKIGFRALSCPAGDGDGGKCG